MNHKYILTVYGAKKSTSNQSFGEYLADKRKRKGLTVRQIAAEMDISPAYYSDVENHRRKGLPTDTLNKLPSILSLTDEEKHHILFGWP